MKDAHEIFASNCRRLRDEAGMTQDELAEASGLSGAYISEIERGNANPTLATVQKLANGLNVHISELVDFRDAEATEEEIRARLIQVIAKADNKTVRGWLALLKKVFR